MRALALALPAFALVLAALAPLSPPAAAQAPDGEALCIIFVRPSADWTRVEIAVDLILTKEDVANVTRDVDADADGNVTRDEVATYEAASVRDVPFADLGEKALRLDGAEPRAVTFSTRLGAFEGPVAGAGANRTVTEVRWFDFATPIDGATRHEVQGGPGADYRPPPTSPTPPTPSVVIETVVITAPPGWLVESVNGTRHDAKEVTIRGFDTRSPFVITFAEPATDPTPRATPPGDRIPGPDAAVGLAALAGTALALARASRRRVRSR